MPREGVGRAPELLLDQHPLELRPALPSVFAGVQPAVELRRHRLGADPGEVLGRQLAARPLGLLLERHQHVLDVAARPRLELGLLRGELREVERRHTGTFACPLRDGIARRSFFQRWSLQDLLGRVVPAGGHDAAARVRARAAQVQAVDRRRVLRQRRRRAHERHLVQALLALEDVAAEQPEDPLEVRRGEHLVVHDRVLDVRRHRAERVEALLPVALARALGPALLVVGPVLGEHRHHGRAVVGQRVVDRGRHLDLEVRRLRRPPAHRVLPGALEVVDRGAERDAGAQQHVPVLVGHALVVRGLGEHPVDLHRPAARLVALQVLDDLVGEVLGPRQVEHRRLGVRPRDDHPCPKLLARLERHAEHAPVADVDRADCRAGADRRARRLRRLRDRHRDRAHAALDVAPQPGHAVDLSQARGAAGCRRCPACAARPTRRPRRSRRSRPCRGRSRTSRRAGRRPTSSSRGRSRGRRAWTGPRRAPPRAAARTGRPGAWSRSSAAASASAGAGTPPSARAGPRRPAAPRRPSSRSARATRPSSAGRCGRTARGRRRRSPRRRDRAGGPRSRSP